MDEKLIIAKLDKIEDVMNELQEQYGISGLDKFDVIDLLDEIKEELYKISGAATYINECADIIMTTYKADAA